jgi:hypothetical protein
MEETREVQVFLQITITLISKAAKGSSLEEPFFIPDKCIYVT